MMDVYIGCMTKKVAFHQTEDLVKMVVLDGCLPDNQTYLLNK